MKYRVLYLNMFCVWRLSTVTILGNCLVWLMSGSGKDNRWNLTIPPWCVFLCVSVSFLHLFCFVLLLFVLVKSALDRAHTVLYLACPGYVLLSIRRWIRSHPPDTTLPHLFVSTADGANNKRVFRGVRLLLLSANEKSPGSSPESHWNQTELTWPQTKPQLQTLNSDKKGCQTFASHSDSLVSCTDFLL